MFVGMSPGDPLCRFTNVPFNVRERFLHKKRIKFERAAAVLLLGVPALHRQADDKRVRPELPKRLPIQTRKHLRLDLFISV